jgi:hypothetical protein
LYTLYNNISELSDKLYLFENCAFSIYLNTDPGRGGEGNDEEGDPYEILKSNLDAAYDGNRAPIPFYIHVFWFNGVSALENIISVLFGGKSQTNY